MEEMNIFEQASRVQLRFELTGTGLAGNLSTEDLWKLKVTSKRQNVITLDLLYQYYTSKVQQAGISLVGGDALPEDKLRIKIIEHIFNVRNEEAKAAETREAKLARKRQIEELLLSKQQEKLSEKSEEELLEELKALDI